MRSYILGIVIIIILFLAFKLFFYPHLEHLDNVSIEKSKLKQIIYKDMLRRTKRALDKLDIVFFLSSGTCLGYFRDGKIIDHDYDIDVGIWNTDYKQEIIKAMDNEGLKLYRVWGNPKDGMELSFVLPNTKLGRHAKIDIFLHYKDTDDEGNKTVSWYTYSPKKKRIQYRVSDFDVKMIKFLNTDLYVPDPTLKYIEDHYGKDWKIPIKPGRGYRYYQSPKSIVK